MEERRLRAASFGLDGGMEASSCAGAAPGKQYVLFDQFGSPRSTVLLHCESAADGQPKLLGAYDASDLLRPQAFTGGAGEMLDMVCGGGGRRREDHQQDTLVELQGSSRPGDDEAIEASRTETSSSSWHENSQEIEALIMESDDDEDGSVTSGLAHSSGVTLGDQSDGEASVASVTEQRVWDDSLLSICAPRWSVMEARKRRIRRRMKTLRSWVPGGNKLDSIRVLEEVIRYFRSEQQIERKIQY